MTIEARATTPKATCRLKNSDVFDMHTDVAVKTGRPVHSFGYTSKHFGMHELLMHISIGIGGFWTGVQPAPPQQAHRHRSLYAVLTHRTIKQATANMRVVVHFIPVKKQGDLCYN